MASVTGMTAAAITSIEDSINAALAEKADLVGGLLPDSQLPADVITTTSLATSLSTKADLVGGVVPDAQVPAIAQKRGELQINVKDKGATGNGSTADDAGILAAIAAVPSTGGIVLLPPGQFLLSGSAAMALTATGITIQGSGREATQIVIGSGFTGPAAISITGKDCAVRDLSIVGQSTTTTSNPNADGILVSGNRRAKVDNVNFWYINGWAIEEIASSSSSGNPDGSQITRIMHRNCAGGLHIMGNTGSGYAVNSFVSNFQGMQCGVTTGPAANLDGVRIEDAWDVLMENIFSWTSVGLGHSLHIMGNCAATFVKNLDTLGPSTASCVLIEDGPNGSPQNVQIQGGVIQQGTSGLRITGGASHVHVGTMRFINNNSHAISVEGTGGPIAFHDCFISGSGAGATGTNYDINWTGSSTGWCENVRFASPVVASGTAGVQYSVNITAAQAVRFINTLFLGTGAAAANWFTATPSAVLDTSGGGFNFVTTANFGAGATFKANASLQPSAQGNTVISSNTNGTDQYDSWRLDGTGKMSVGPGGTVGTRDASWGRQGTAIFGTADSDVQIGLLGKGLKIKAGTNGKVVTATLASGTVTISNTSITANSCIIPFYRTPAGTVGALYVSAVTVGTSCVIKSTSSTDTSVIGVLIVEAV